MRALVYYVATSLDGFIADPQDRYDAFVVDDDLLAFHTGYLDRFDAVVMGRRTYDIGLALGVTSPYPQMAEQVVFSRTLTRSPDPAVTVTSDDPVAAVRAMKAQDGGDIWLCGGGDLAAQLLAADLVDELVVKLNPFVMGDGIPLFAPHTAATRWHHASTETAGDLGIQVLTYHRSPTAVRPPRRDRRGAGRGRHGRPPTPRERAGGPPRRTPPRAIQAARASRRGNR